MVAPPASFHYGQFAVAAFTMLPYVQVPAPRVGDVVFDTVTLASCLGVAVGIALAHVRASRLGIGDARLISFLAWILFGAVIGGHWAEALCYNPSEVFDPLGGTLRSGWFEHLLEIWRGWRSIGGFFGAIVAAFVWRSYEFKLAVLVEIDGVATIEGYWFVRRETPEPILPLADIVLSVFPFGWVLREIGLALVHAHPGTRAATGSWLAMPFPELKATIPEGFAVIHTGVPRYDLGLLEALATASLIVVAIAVSRRRRTPGVCTVVVGLTYASARFGLEFLRRRTGAGADPRFAALTPAQWGCAALLLLIAVVCLQQHRRPGREVARS